MKKHEQVFPRRIDFAIAKGMAANWAAQLHIGHIYLFGLNLNACFHHPFLKDHDYVRIVNRTSGKSFAVTPDVFDYTGIVCLSNRL